MSKQKNQEIEVRFLEVNKKEIIKKLKALGARDLKENLLKEIIFSDPQITWPAQDRLVRLRMTGKKLEVAYKHHHNKKDVLNQVEEIEFELLSSFEKAKVFFQTVGLIPLREQHKKRHSFLLDQFRFDLDTWPTMPTYLEIEGPSEKALKQIAAQLGLEWSKVIFEDAARVIKNYYNIPVKELKFFTFEKIE